MLYVFHLTYGGISANLRGEVQKQKGGNKMCDVPIMGCGNDACGKTFPMPTGVGSTPMRSDKDGGHYFCSETCAEVWENQREENAR